MDPERSITTEDATEITGDVSVQTTGAVTCPNCGHDQFDEDGNCAKCRGFQIVRDWIDAQDQAAGRNRGGRRR